MNGEIQLIGNQIIELQHSIAKEVHEARIEGISDEERIQLSVIEEDILKTRAHFISLFGNALQVQADEKTAFDIFTKWGKETAEYTYALGIPLDEALKDTRYYRTYLWKTIKDTVKSNSLSIDTVFEACEILDPLLDHAAYSFSVTYVQFHQQTLENARKAFLELSVPVVPLIKGKAILPLIGNIDTGRAQFIMEETLKSVSRLNLNQLIIDLSGVAIVDTMVADQIFKVVSALKLLGVETIITGIRPEVAQTIVSLGVDFQDIKVKANLHQALSKDLHQLEKIM